MKLRANYCLVKLAPVPDTSASGLLLAPALAPTISYGKVMQTAPDVDRYGITVGDVVAFAPSQGELLDGMFPTPHILIPATSIDAVIEKRTHAA